MGRGRKARQGKEGGEPAPFDEPGRFGLPESFGDLETEDEPGTEAAVGTSNISLERLMQALVALDQSVEIIVRPARHAKERYKCCRGVNHSVDLGRPGESMISLFTTRGA